MIHRNNLTIIISIVIVILTGCAKQLTHDLQGSFPLDYMQDSKLCVQKAPVKVAIGKVVNQATIEDSTYAQLTYLVPIPLLFVNIVSSGYLCKLGRSSFDSKIEEFLRSSFIKEAKRSGCFEIVEDGSEDYIVDLAIVKQETKGPYSTFFYMYFALYVYGYGYGETAGPGESNIALKMDLKGKDGRILHRQFESKNVTEMLRGKNNGKELRRNYAIGLVESVSFAFKKCIDNSVLAINQFTSNKQVDVGRETPIEQNGDIEINKK